jgi:predicted DNA-binding protein with PD1-like motif
MKILLPLLLCSAAAFAADDLAPVTKMEVFPMAKIDAVYRIRIPPDSMVLETIQAFIAKNGIQDGAVLTGLGSVHGCTVHGVGSKMRVFTEDMELDSLEGIIASGEPHLHAVLSYEKGAVGGHLEKNCRVLSHVELTIVHFSGTPVLREKGELKAK